MSGIEEDKKLVVKAINRLRKEAGLGRITKLRRGVPMSNHACPIAMSLEGISVAAINSSRATASEFLAIGRVMKAVDTGKCPELEIPKTVPMMKKNGDRKRTPIL